MVPDTRPLNANPQRTKIWKVLVFLLFFALLIVCEIAGGFSQLPGLWKRMSGGGDRELHPLGFSDLAGKGFDLIFVLAFFGFSGFAIHHAWQRSKLEQLHPDQPHLWERRWQEGRIRNSIRFPWLSNAVDLVWKLLFSTFFLPFCLSSDRSKIESPWFFSLILIISLGLLIQYVLTCRRCAGYGDAVFCMKDVPGRIGGVLAGMIELPPRQRMWTVAKLEFVCLKGSGEDERVFWRSEAADALINGFGEECIPVLFQIPPECSPTESEGGNIAWRLHLKESRRRGKILASFEVPVFR